MTRTKRLAGLAALTAALGMAPAQAQTEVVLHNFRPMTGSGPYGGLIRDSAGNLYGTARNGLGSHHAGVVFKLGAGGHYAVLHDFSGGADGGQPFGGVIRDSAANLYGTTLVGGAANAGVVFKIDASGQETVLYSFTGGADGGRPTDSVVFDPAGNLYGTTGIGGTASQGVVFKLDTAGKETVLHTFTGGADGGQPYAGVILDPVGNLYGTATAGGAGYGVVYKLDPAGNETVLHTFTGGDDGNEPYGGVIRDSAGNLYGTTLLGGAANCGVVFRLSKAGREKVLYSFTNEADGRNPASGVIRDSAGNLYGTVGSGGPADAGVVYELDAAGGFTTLYSFSGARDGGAPQASLLRNSKGYLYGTAVEGGKGEGGTLFEIKP